MRGVGRRDDLERLGRRFGGLGRGWPLDKKEFVPSLGLGLIVREDTGEG